MNIEEEEDNKPRESQSPRRTCRVVITKEHDSSGFGYCLANGPHAKGYIGKEGERVTWRRSREEGA